jgi:hypothetical protein
MTTVNIKEGKYKVVLDSADNNHTLHKFVEGGYEVRNPKGGMMTKKPSWELVGYFPNMKQCITTCIGLEVAKGEDVYTMEQYLVKLEGIVKDLNGRMTK